MPQQRGLQTTRGRSSALPNKYTYIFAHGETHALITDLKEMRKHDLWEVRLGLFCNGIPVGTGRFSKENWKKKYIHTESCYLSKNCRRKGHGIQLYMALIKCAKELGAVRLYSSHNLNKFSRRMWKTKLSRYGFEVHTINSCRKACKHCSRSERYYINL